MINRNSRFPLSELSVVLLLGIICGCAPVKECLKGFAGVSTKILEDNRQTALSREINYPYQECYAKTMQILQNIGAYVYSKDNKKQLIAIYVSEEDTTPVGIFFQQKTDNITKIEVSSPSTYAKELIAGRLFAGLEKKKPGK